MGWGEWGTRELKVEGGKKSENPPKPLCLFPSFLEDGGGRGSLTKMR